MSEENINKRPRRIIKPRIITDEEKLEENLWK